jgi:mono/diheme cytochrome c family protein
MHILNSLSRVLILTGATLGLLTTAHAEDHDTGRQVAPLPKYQQECAACHIAFSPGMLPAASWQHLMSTLDKHFSADASLDPASVQEISSWLKANAGTYKRVGEVPAQDRITKSAWFLRKHRDGEVPAAVWKRAAVGSPSNCAACHPKAEQGNFNEHEVRIPK